MESGGKKRKLVDSLFMTPLQKKKKLQEQTSADNKISIEGVAPSKAMKSSFEYVTENMKMKNNFETTPKMAPDITGKSYHGEDRNSAREATSARDQLICVTEEVKAQERIDQIKENVGSKEAEASNGGSPSDVSESDDVSSSCEEADPLLSSSPYEEDDSDTEELVEQEKFWNVEQMEILQSAVPSFQFLPRTTTDKVATELMVGDSNYERAMYNLSTGIGRLPLQGKVFRPGLAGKEGQVCITNDLCTFMTGLESRYIMLLSFSNDPTLLW